MSKRIIVIEQNHEITKKLEVDENTVLKIGDFQIKVSEFTGIASYSKDDENIDIMSLPATVSTLEIKL
ncbi:hypothetical protein [Heyndrickxia sp. FSL W8-0423]|uniref:hypothetical protein n=1 Tax=Heyndrickxia sp. FSL W8-0423 TaxID=2921601 RepID=UPI0030F853CC